MYDLVIVGAGPGGVSAALKAVRNGLSVALIEKNNFGGVCLNSGCMPTKFYLQRLNSNLSVQELFDEKEKLIGRLRKSAEQILTKSGVELIKGNACFVGPDIVEVGGQEIAGKNFIIASGSTPKSFELNTNSPITDPEAFLLKPFDRDDYAIVGGGAIGIEYAFMLSGLGKQVTIFEKQERILPFADIDISKKILQLLKRKKISVFTAVDLQEHDLNKYGEIIMSVGRTANTGSLQLESAGVKVADGWVCTDDNLRTDNKRIFACGDVRGEFLYAYSAEYEAEFIVDVILGEAKVLNTDSIPTCVFAQPAVASVGATQKELDDANIDYTQKIVNNIAFSSAHIYDDKDGLFKIIVDSKGKILGAHIVSKYASELIGYFALCMRNDIPIDAIKNTIFIHPTISEVLVKMWD